MPSSLNPKLETMLAETSNKICGCKGIRSCRLCKNTENEVQALFTGNHNVQSNVEKKTCYFCVHCKKAYQYTRVDSLAEDQSLQSSFPECQNEDLPNNTSVSSPGATSNVLELKEDNKLCQHKNVLHKMNFPGITIIENFVSPDEEFYLDAAIKETPFQKSQSGRQKQDFGPKVNFKKQKIRVSSFNGLPSYSRFLFERMGAHSCLKDFQPVELCNLEYCIERGAHIDPHFDDAWLWGERLVTLNLMSDSCLTFTLDEDPFLEVRVPLLRRSLIVVSAEARYHWKHGISETDVIGRRVAMTFRELSEEFSRGGSKEEEGKNLLTLALTFQGTAIQPANVPHWD
ncbi:alpha-ketoglutarate-dependent dioxygenase alkB 4 [Biomphalaria pfeifferi]|uniref:Alpha-ketoglutarate-dependent dioxygenase alkB 4 n=1 Tax=Biomphalaria pfeifferi TaxID=112525 RepID=A0AAD8BS73_BIOPF|nr:alpha-ketoglutarate-dependent dioxygenase alkB 4 [Biomphalaria pfeifferi]